MYIALQYFALTHCQGVLFCSKKEEILCQKHRKKPD